MMPNHHPFPETLMSYSSGTLPGALSGAVACHVAMCSQCAGHVRQLEMLGGLLLDQVEDASSDSAAGGRQTGYRFEDRPGELFDIASVLETDDDLLPAPLARYLGADGRNLSWEEAGGLQQSPVELPGGSGSMKLLRLSPGQQLAELDPSSAQLELVLVLQGILSGNDAEYVRGDMLDLTDGEGRAAAAAGEVDCICLVASSDEDADRARTGAPRGIAMLPDVRLRKYWSGPAALAASLALVLGLGLGWLLAGDPYSNGFAADDFVMTEGRRLVAQWPLDGVLESLPSGEEDAISAESGPVRLGVVMTFRNQAGDYCRQYRIESSSGNYSGIACRSDGEWAVQLQALVPPRPRASEKTVPAGGETDAAIGAVIGSLISGNALAGEDEAKLMRQNWRD